MTSRGDELAEAVALYLTGGDGVSLNEALHRYRNSAPSEETHERVEMAIRRVDGDLIGDEPGCGPYPTEPVLAKVTFYLPKPAPVPEITAEEVES